MTFFSSRDIKSTRKEHRCEACSGVIPVASPAYYFSTNYDGDFYDGYFHIECRAAELHLNEINGCMGGDDWLSICDLDPEDRDWLQSTHPLVFQRIYGESIQ